MPLESVEPAIPVIRRLQIKDLIPYGYGIGTNDPYSHKIRASNINMPQSGVLLLQQKKSKSNVPRPELSTIEPTY